MGSGAWGDEVMSFDVDRRPPTDRRWIGVLLLAVGLLVTLVSNTNPKAPVAGQAATAPLPDPPAVGSCLLLEQRTVTVTACEEPHNAEVTANWQAGAAPPEFMRFELLVSFSYADDMEPACQSAQADYMNYSQTDPTGIWRPVRPIVHSRLIVAPPGQRTATAGWTTCIVISPKLQLYTGSVRGGYRGTPLPSFFANCVLNRAAPSPTGDCGDRHPLEVLGILNPAALIDDSSSFTGEIPDESLQASCLALAATLTGAADPTFAGGLRVVAEPLIPQWFYDVAAADDTGRPVTLQVPAQLCVAEVTGARLLIDTVIGVQGGPLPLD